MPHPRWFPFWANRCNQFKRFNCIPCKKMSLNRPKFTFSSVTAVQSMTAFAPWSPILRKDSSQFKHWMVKGYTHTLTAPQVEG